MASRVSGQSLVKVALACLTGLLVTAAVFTSVSIARRQAALRDVSRYNATWLVSQTTLEVERLTAAAAAFAMPGSGVDKDEVQLRLDIVISRLASLRKGEVGDFIRNRPDLNAAVMRLQDAVHASEDLIDTFDDPGSALKVFKLLSPSVTEVTRLAAAVHEHGGELVGLDIHELRSLQWTFAGLLTGVITCSLALAGVLWWNAKLLQSAHSAVQKLASELHTQNSRFDAALNNMSQALCMISVDHKLIVCNARFSQLFRVPPEALAPGSLEMDVFDAAERAGEFDRAMMRRLQTKHAALAAARAPLKFVEEDSQGRALAVSFRPMPEGGWVTTYEDVTEQRRAEARMSFMARHDALTTLPNRLEFQDRLGAALDRLGRGDTQLAVYCLDLDRFKQVNDTLGHPAGDALLKIVAQRLRGCIRADDVAARMGGDEFAIFGLSAGEPHWPDQLAHRIGEALRAPYDLEGHRALIGVSIGIATAADPAMTPDMLLKNADVALYRAKTEGRGIHCFFESRMAAELQARRAIEIDLASALDDGGLEVHYQPLLSLSTNKVTGFEALLRWHHHERGTVSPEAFIPVAEETGLIEEVGAWVLQQACTQATKWPSHLKIAVNLSPIQFGGHIVKMVKNALDSSGLHPSRLELEITESALLNESITVVTKMHELRKLGVRMALDDFGTGYSALSYLRSFPFDKIKIDRGFVREIAIRKDSRAIVDCIIGLAHALGMKTTAEGVETADQLAQLRDAGCTEIQGYILARPGPAADMQRWFSATQDALRRPEPVESR